MKALEKQNICKVTHKERHFNQVKSLYLFNFAFSMKINPKMKVQNGDRNIPCKLKIKNTRNGDYLPNKTLFVLCFGCIQKGNLGLGR